MYDRTARRIIAIATVVCISIVMVYYLFFSKYAIFPLMGRPVHHYIRIEKEGLGDIFLRNVKSVKPYLFKAENGTEVSVVLRAKPYWEIKKVELRGVDTKVIEPPINTTTYSLNFTLLANTTIHVVFARIPEFELEVIVDGEGSVDVSSTRVLRGRTIEVNIEPAEGWFIESVRLDSEDLGTVDRLSIEMWSDRVLEVKFHKWAYLNITVVGNATIEVEGAEPVNGLYRAPEGSNVTVSIKCPPSSLKLGYYLRSIVLDGGYVLEPDLSRRLSQYSLRVAMVGRRELLIETYKLEYAILRLNITGRAEVKVCGEGIEEISDYEYRVLRGWDVRIEWEPLVDIYEAQYWALSSLTMSGDVEVREEGARYIVIRVLSDLEVRLKFVNMFKEEGLYINTVYQPYHPLMSAKLGTVEKRDNVIVVKLDPEDDLVMAYIPLNKNWTRVKLRLELDVGEDVRHWGIEVYGYIGRGEMEGIDIDGYYLPPGWTRAREPDAIFTVELTRTDKGIISKLLSAEVDAELLINPDPWTTTEEEYRGKVNVRTSTEPGKGPGTGTHRVVGYNWIYVEVGGGYVKFEKDERGHVIGGEKQPITLTIVVLEVE